MAEEPATMQPRQNPAVLCDAKLMGNAEGEGEGNGALFRRECAGGKEEHRNRNEGQELGSEPGRWR